MPLSMLLGSWMGYPSLLSKFLGKLEEFAKKHPLKRICLEETSIVLVLIDVFSFLHY